MSTRNKTYTSRWAEGDSYKLNWKERSRQLWDMFKSSERQPDKKYKIDDRMIGICFFEIERF